MYIQPCFHCLDIYRIHKVKAIDIDPYLYVVIATVVMVLQGHHSEREHDVHPRGHHHGPGAVPVVGVVPGVAGAGQGPVITLVQQSATD